MCVGQRAAGRGVCVIERRSSSSSSSSSSSRRVWRSSVPRSSDGMAGQQRRHEQQTVLVLCRRQVVRMCVHALEPRQVTGMRWQDAVESVQRRPGCNKQATTCAISLKAAFQLSPRQAKARRPPCAWLPGAPVQH
jgi:hypothetical protein